MKCTLHLLLCLVFVIGCIPDSGAQTIHTIAGTGAQGYGGDGSAATLATFINPTSLALDKNGNVYVTDMSLASPFMVVPISVVRKIDRATGTISTIAGQANLGFGGDGGPATAATFDLDWGIAIDGPGDIYITDEQNNRVREIGLSGTINTIAGTNGTGYTGDNGPATLAQIGTPVGIALDGAGNLFFCDQYHYVVRKVTTGGIITTVAGNGSSGYSSSGGPATQASFNLIFGLATDAAGNLYICDADNNQVRMVNTSGYISTVAGNGTAGYNGDAIPATNANLNHPTGVCVDGAGNIYIADYHNNRIRKVSRSGIISTIAGNGTPGDTGNNGPATAAELNSPTGIAMDSFENIYFTDLGNAKVKEIYKNLIFSYGHHTGILVCENVLSHIFTDLDTILSVQDLTTGTTDTWSLTSGPTNGTADVSYSHASTGGVIVPSGLYYSPNTGYIGPDSFTVKVTNGTDSSFITVYITVESILSYAGVIDGPSYVCVGSQVTLTDTVGNGTWNISNLDANVSNGVVTGIVPGTDTVNYTISNSCGSATVFKAISIYPLPDAGTITGNSAICINSTSAYTDNVAGGAWSSHNPHASLSPAGIDTAFTAGQDTIFYSVKDAFCTGTSSFVIEIDSFPFARISPWDTTVCAGTVYNLIDTPAGGNWTTSGSNITIAQQAVSAVSAGMDTMYYAITNACGTVKEAAYVTVYPLPVTPTITQNGSTLSVPAGYNAYQWYFNGSQILGSVVDTYLVANTGQYSVYVRNEYGCSVISPPITCDGCTPNDIVVYPNPTESIVYIKWCRTVIIKVLCDDGKKYELVTGVNSADLSALPNADYLIVLYDLNGNKLKTEKISKDSR